MIAEGHTRMQSLQLFQLQLTDAAVCHQIILRPADDTLAIEFPHLAWQSATLPTNLLLGNC